MVTNKSSAGKLRADEYAAVKAKAAALAKKSPPVKPITPPKSRNPYTNSPTKVEMIIKNPITFLF